MPNTNGREIVLGAFALLAGWLAYVTTYAIDHNDRLGHSGTLAKVEALDERFNRVDAALATLSDDIKDLRRE